MPKKKEKKEVDPQAWMFSFSDLLTNMLTFFVLLYSMSSMNDLAFEYSLGPSLRGALGVLNRGGYTSIGAPRFMPISMPPTEEFALIGDAVVKALLTKDEGQSADGSMPVSENFQTIEIYANNRFAHILFPAKILFEKNSAEILPQMTKQLIGIAELLKKFAHPVRINGYSHQEPAAARHKLSLGHEVPLFQRGHGGIRTSGGEDKFAVPSAAIEDLSLKRASAVLHFFISKGGLAPEQCSLAGYGNLRNEERKGKSMDYVEIFILKATDYST